MITLTVESLIIEVKSSSGVYDIIAYAPYNEFHDYIYFMNELVGKLRLVNPYFDKRLESTYKNNEFLSMFRCSMLHLKENDTEINILDEVTGEVPFYDELIAFYHVKVHNPVYKLNKKIVHMFNLLVRCQNNPSRLEDYLYLNIDNHANLLL